MCKRCEDFKVAVGRAAEAHNAYRNTAFGASNDRTLAVVNGHYLVLEAHRLFKLPCTCK